MSISGPNSLPRALEKLPAVCATSRQTVWGASEERRLRRRVLSLWRPGVRRRPGMLEEEEA
eukprot:2578958-Rhodomonas_salina.1